MAIETDTKIGVFFGSRSPEHDVSIITGSLIYSGLKQIGYTVYPVYLSEDGGWYIDEELGNVDFFKEDNFKDRLGKLPKFSLDVSGQTDGLLFTATKGFSKKQVFINFAFPAFHGTNGEDGVAQGFFELFNIPYVGCDVASSALAMDKVLTKTLFEDFDIPTTEYISFTHNQWEEYQEEILKSLTQLKGALFIKPARTGSSIGITKVVSREEIQGAVEVAFHYDTKVLVERAVENVKDLTVCVIGHNELHVSEIQESRFNKDFFSYEDKYLNEGGAQLGNATQNIIIPADLPADVSKRIKSMAQDIFRIFECSGIARFDFLYNQESGDVYANEINPLPGTLYHHLWKESGVSLSSLLKKLIRFAEEKKEEKRRTGRKFKSTILKEVSTNKLSQKLHINE